MGSECAAGDPLGSRLQGPGAPDAVPHPPRFARTITFGAGQVSDGFPGLT